VSETTNGEQWLKRLALTDSQIAGVRERYLAAADDPSITHVVSSIRALRHIHNPYEIMKWHYWTNRRDRILCYLKLKARGEGVVLIEVNET